MAQEETAAERKLRASRQWIAELKKLKKAELVRNLHELTGAGEGLNDLQKHTLARLIVAWRLKRKVTA